MHTWTEIIELSRLNHHENLKSWKYDNFYNVN